MGYSFWLTVRVLLYASFHRQDSKYHGLCYTSRGALAGTRNSSMGPPHEESIRRPITPWANALATHRQGGERTHGPTDTRTDQTGLGLLSSITVPCAALMYILFQPVLHDWCNKGCGMCYPVCGMMHIKEPLLLIRKSSPYGGSRFPLLLSECHITIYKMCWVRR